MSDTLLDVRDLRRVFAVRGAHGGHEELVALDGVSFALRPGGALAVVGESGSGKTTAARIVAGLERPTAGTVAFDGEPRTDWNPGRAERKRRARQVQMVFQDPYGSLDRRLTVRRALQDVLRRHRPQLSAREGEERIGSLLERVGLAQDLAHSRPHQLSGGQRQRVAIAKALAVDPAVLVLDEAVSALDVSVQAQILELLDGIRRDSGVALVFVSHDLAVVGRITDTVLVMYRGEAVEQGATDAVLRRPSHPYTEMLRSSAPGPGWQPERVAELRAAFAGTP
jgi:ABC-type glutathione transport system ATPase component